MDKPILPKIDQKSISDSMTTSKKSNLKTILSKDFNSNF